jgi:hypothetical protein
MAPVPAARRSRGDAVLFRHLYGGRPLLAVPSRVVEDGADALVTWVEPGSEIAYPAAIESGRRLLPLDRWDVTTRSWYGTGVLDLTPAGRAHMIRHFWNDDGSFRAWYVNLQAPLVQRGDLLDTTDHQLDIWVEPDGAVTWKDEDHLEQAVEIGLFTRAEAAAIRVEGERVLDEWPFPTGWEGFRPPAGWEPLELPPGWDVA